MFECDPAVLPLHCMKGEGFDVMKSGDARVALIGFPSVGKVHVTLLVETILVIKKLLLSCVMFLLIITGTLHKLNTDIIHSLNTS